MRRTSRIGRPTHMLLLLSPRPHQHSVFQRKVKMPLAEFDCLKLIRNETLQEQHWTGSVVPALPCVDCWCSGGERKGKRALTRIIFQWTFFSSLMRAMLGFFQLQLFFFFCKWENRPWLCSSANTQQWQPTVDHVCTKASSRSLVLLVPPVQWHVASGALVAAPEDSNVREITNYHVNCDQWRVIHISKEFIEWTWVYKKCALYVFYFYWLSIDLCWLLTLGMFFGGTGDRARRKVVPILLKQCFCSGLMNLSVFVFVLFVFSLSWRSREGSVSAKLKDKKSWGLWQREK